MGKHTIAALSSEPFRHTVAIVLREELGTSEETEFLVDWVEDMWATIDTLVSHFGEEDARKIILARLGVGSFNVLSHMGFRREESISCENM